MIKLTLSEKCYLVALFGDIPEHRREGLFSVSSLPPQTGPAVFYEGYRYVAQIKRAPVKHTVRRRRLRRKLWDADLL